ncbi:MAG: radical SAM family heme chaperone HemW [SAR324 cluster bacterium]|nr:radical SAM family heme chaperone HemW [SAR324 cluster bacterium]
MNLEQKNQKIYSPVPAVYLHIPFCRHICPFCSFAVRRDRVELHEKYILGMLDEIARRAAWMKEKKQINRDLKLSGHKFLESIYFGGGTPSSLTIPEVELLLSQVRNCFPCSDQVEISFEMNPEDVNPEYLSGLAEIGVNRLSLGGQSFQTLTLKKLGRIHSGLELRKAVKAIANSAIENWNLDLMFGIPEQSIAMFKNDVEEALSYNPSHISLYGLEIHEKTPFGKNKQIRKWDTEHQQQFEEMYLWANARLIQARLFQYEVSNFSLKTKEGRNNLLVWSGNEYLGFGVGAHSYLSQTRWGNKRSLNTYLKDLEHNSWPVDFEEQLQVNEQAAESLMLALRQPKGVNIEQWQKRFGLQWKKQQLDLVEELCTAGRAFRKGQHLCLTAKGMLLADRITVELMPESHIK